MIKLLKILLLAACAGIFLLALFVMPTLLAPTSPYLDLWSWHTLQEMFFLFLLGSVICLVFGTPCLLLIDKYFSRFQLRYMIGGAVAGWVAWFFMCGPFVTVGNPWNDTESWVADGINHVCLYIGLGFATGTLFTLLLNLACRIARNKSSSPPTPQLQLRDHSLSPSQQ